MDSGLETALVSASIAALVSLSVAIFSPLFTHHLWKRQKRKEQQLALAERFAVLRAELRTYDDNRDQGAWYKWANARTEMSGLLFVVQVLFEKDDVIIRAKKLRGVQNPETIEVQRVELQTYLFAEALDVSFDKIPTFPVHTKSDK
jgi:hypothetical protein